MTRKFVHLTLVLVLSMVLASCSMLESSDKQSADEIENETSNLGDEVAGGSDDGFSDLDVEEAAPSQASSSDEASVSENEKSTNEDSFSDIEDFNQGLIENELSDKDLGSKVAADQKVDDGITDFSEDFDIESASVDQVDKNTMITPEPVVSKQSVSADSVMAENAITNLEYKSYDSGGTVVITAEKPFIYQVREEPRYNQAIIEIGDISLPERFKLPYIAKDFGQAVATVNAYQEKGSTTARFVIQYKSKIKPSVQQRENSLLVMNGGSAGAQNYVADASFDATSKSNTTTTDTNSSSSFSSTDKSGIAGKKISIEFYGEDIKQVIQYIADLVGVNLIIDDDANGVVNVRLRNVGWEEGLSQILNAHGLGYERRGQILRIAKTDKMTREIREAQERLKAEADSEKLTLPKVMKIIPINYGDLASLERQIAPLLDTNTEKVTSDARSNSLVITGFPKSIKRVEELVKSLDVEPLQVMIEGKIIEANTEFGREFGIRWTSSTTFDVGGQNGTLSSVVSGDRSGAAFGFLADISVGSVDVLGDLSALLSIFESEQKIKILSSPKISVLNKEKAKINQVTNVPNFSSTTASAATGVTTATTVSFTPAKLELSVTPQISSNSDMILEISVDRDIPGSALINGSVPVNTRHAETKIKVRDGQSAVLGGIFNMDDRVSEVGVPWLKDIPLLGNLFKSKVHSFSKNELVVFLYPKILTAANSLSGVDFNKNSDTSFNTNGSSGSGNSVSPNGTDDLDKEFDSL